MAVLPKFQEMSKNQKGSTLSYLWEFRLILKFLNICGYTPVSYYSGQQQQHFNLVWRSRTVLVAIFGGLVATMLWFTYILRFVAEVEMFPGVTVPHRGVKAALSKDQSLPPEVRALTLTCLSAAFDAIPFFHLSNMFFEWKNARLLVRFLQRCQEFEKLAGQGLIQPLQTPLFRRQMFRFRLLMYILIPGLIGFVTLFLMQQDRQVPVQALLYQAYITLLLVTAECADDVKHFLAYQTIRDGFDQVANDIQYTRENNLVTRGRILLWQELTDHARENTELLSEYQKPTQLLFTGRCILNVTLFLFMVLNIPVTSSSRFFFHLAWGSYGCFPLVRLLQKTALAESISAAEYKVAKSLYNLEKHLGPELQRKVKSMYYMMTEHPSKITFGTYIVFQKGLLLSVFSQVVTYLIVLMQFRR